MMLIALPRRGLRQFGYLAGIKIAVQMRLILLRSVLLIIFSPGGALMRILRRGSIIMCAAVMAVTTLVAVPQVGHADPLPGFDLDPVQLEERMEACMDYSLPPGEMLMGWVNLRTGDERRWRCSSLRHMILDVGTRNPPVSHDPFVNVPDFMRCVDEVVTGGFPRPATNPAYTALIKQYQGTSRRAEVVVNDGTGDIVTIFTSPNNDWTGCANAL